MYLKYFSLAALASSAFAQSSQSLNATLAGNNQVSNLTQILSANPSLIEALNNAKNITILAPNNAAFARLANSSVASQLTNSGLVQALLQYHVLNGTYSASQLTNTSTFIPTLLTDPSYTNVTGGQRVQGVKVGNQTAFYSGLLQNATVTQADLNFTGGTIHIIDRVLSIPGNVSDAARDTNLTAFRGALNATNLTQAVSGARDVTIFAPNNNAFQSIGSALASLSVTDLVSILGYHVINGTVGYSSALRNGTSLKSVGGGNITVTIQNGTVFANSARILTPNILIANGVLHIVDNVLNPNSTTVRPSATATAGSPAFTGSSASQVPFTSGQPTPSTTVNLSSAGPGPASARASSSSSGAAVPMKTGAVGAAALFGGAAALLNY